MKLEVKRELCSGCRTCEVLCGFSHYGELNPKKAALKVRGDFPVPGTYDVSVCTQCGVCAEECPEQAISLADNGAYKIDKDLCTGCGICVDVCPEGAMFTHEEEVVPIKCDLCNECVAICPRDALSISDGKGA